MSDFATRPDEHTVQFVRILPGPIERIWAYLWDGEKRGAKSSRLCGIKGKTKESSDDRKSNPHWLDAGRGVGVVRCSIVSGV